jgi:hypothetical protein
MKRTWKHFGVGLLSLVSLSAIACGPGDRVFSEDPTDNKGGHAGVGGSPISQAGAAGQTPAGSAGQGGSASGAAGGSTQGAGGTDSAGSAGSSTETPCSTGTFQCKSDMLFVCSQTSKHFETVKQCASNLCDEVSGNCLNCEPNKNQGCTTETSYSVCDAEGLSKQEHSCPTTNPLCLNGECVTVDDAYPCNANEVPDNNGIFVAQDGNDTNPGTQLLPIKTIKHAQQLLTDNRHHIYLGAGIYKENVAFSDQNTDVIVEGGWNPGWKKECSPQTRNLVQIEGTALNTATIKVNKVNKLLLKSMVVRSKKGSDGAANQNGESVVALHVQSNSQVVLENVHVQAQSAGKGGTASNGTNGTTSSCKRAPVVTPQSNILGLYCQITTASECNPNGTTNGSDGSSSTLPTTAGTFTENGFVPAVGSKGQDGTAGKNGPPPATAPEASSCLLGCSKPVSSFVCNQTIYGSICAQPGECGCGGTAGTGGLPGRPGGTSVSVLVGGSSHVHAEFSLISGGKGGDGSLGGKGGSAGKGSAAAAGSPQSCGTEGSCSGTSTFTCPGPDITSSKILKGGSIGGNGTDGGRGGDGAPGVGGVSYSVVELQAGAFSQDVNTTKLEADSGGLNGDKSGPAASGTLLSVK